jgi:hypothetical protein
MENVEPFDPRTWFREDELDVCPFCGVKAVPRHDLKAAVCLSCEVVWIKDDEPTTALPRMDETT